MDLRSTQRLSELDWLRVLLILGVFLHHVAMPFNGDSWHIMNHQSSKLLDDIMVYFEQFRLPILFLISGVGSALLLSKRSTKGFLKERFVRLFIPLLIGIILVVPPQGYIENIQQFLSYWQAYPELLLKFESNHLWFIEDLIIFSVLAIPLTWGISSRVGQYLISALERLSQYRAGLFLLVIGLIAVKVGLKLTFPDDNLSSIFYLLFFIAGMLFIRSESIWQSIRDHRRSNLVILIICSIVFYGYYYSPDLGDYLSLNTRWGIWWSVCCLVAWSALLTLVGYAQHYLTTTPKWLKTGNELIYPFYILHQTIIVVLGFFIISWQASIALKLVTLLLSTLLVTGAICYWVIYPFNFFRVLFGLKIKERSQ